MTQRVMYLLGRRFGATRAARCAGTIGAALLVLGSTASARGAEHGIAVGVPVLYTSMLASPWRFGAALQYDLNLGGDDATPSWLHLGAGLRAFGPVGGATVPLETYTQAQLVGAFGPWRPALGPELGLTGLFRPEPMLRDSSVLTEKHDAVEGYFERREDPGPLYMAFTTSAIRFALGSFTLGVGDLQVGTSVVHPGSAFRFQLELAHLEWVP